MFAANLHHVTFSRTWDQVSTASSDGLTIRKTTLTARLDTDLPSNAVVIDCFSDPLGWNAGLSSSMPNLLRCPLLCPSELLNRVVSATEVGKKNTILNFSPALCSETPSQGENLLDPDRLDLFACAPLWGSYVRLIEAGNVRCRVAADPVYLSDLSLPGQESQLTHRAYHPRPETMQCMLLSVKDQCQILWKTSSCILQQLFYR